MSNTLSQTFEPSFCLDHTFDEECTHCSRRFQVCVGNMIKYRLVTFVSDTGYDRQRHLGNASGQGIRVEVTQVTGRSTTSNDDYNIPLVCLVSNLLERCNDRLLYPTSLHESGEEFELEAIAIIVVLNLLAEIAIACRLRTAYNSYATWKDGHR